MNRNLLVASVFLILVGIAFGFYPVTLIGFFLLFPALLSSPRPGPMKTPTTRPQEQPRRIMPHPTPVTEALPLPAVTAPLPTATPSSSQPIPHSLASYSSALFPNSMFPNLSLASPTQSSTAKTEAPAAKDELLEVGALLAFLKLVLG
ncbi:MAG: hypothetical protein OK438_02790 [Thaumarchaeota archaeon]|nr:hypothetical protein [Nitrososphaerota archaeon]